MNKINKKQQRFIEEYLVDANATQAAIRAGYSAKTANEQASRMLAKVNIKSAIDEKLKLMSSKRIADATEVMEYLTKVMRGESESEVVVVESIGDYTSEARNHLKKPDEKERLKAAELLGKRHGIFKDSLNIDGAIPIVICEDLEEDG